jgi:hypothetical protein
MCRAKFEVKAKSNLPLFVKSQTGSIPTLIIKCRAVRTHLETVTPLLEDETRRRGQAIITPIRTVPITTEMITDLPTIIRVLVELDRLPIPQLRLEAAVAAVALADAVKRR